MLGPPVDTFRFKAVAPDGTARSGVIEAADERTAARDLRGRGLLATYVGAARSEAGVRYSSLGLQKPRGSLRFMEDIATLLESEVPLARALDITADSAESAREGAAARAVLSAVRGGESFADAMSLQPDRFSTLHVSMARAGELSGALPEVMRRLAAFERHREEIRGEVLSALAYPALLIAVGCISLALTARFVLPQWINVIEGVEAELSWLPRTLAGAAVLVHDWWLALFLAPGLTAVGVYTWLRTESGRAVLDTAVLRMPGLGPLVRRASTARFARAMATLLSAAVPMLQALGIANDLVSNRAISAALEPVRTAVRRGDRVSAAIMRSGAFPPLASQLLVIGEETGHLDRMFDRIATVYERQTRESVRRTLALLEPMAILLMAIAVGILVLGTLLALSTIQRVGF